MKNLLTKWIEGIIENYLIRKNKEAKAQEKYAEYACSCAKSGRPEIYTLADFIE